MSRLKPIVAGLLLLTCAEVFSQSQAAHPSFEAVSIKQSAPMPAVFMPGTRLVCPLKGCGGPGTSDPGLIRFTSTSLRHLTEAAYNVPPYRIEAASTLDSPLFDVTAALPQGATPEQALSMLQNLLADRFQLKLHHSTKDLPVYMLVVDKNGPKLRESVQADSPPPAAGWPSLRPRNNFHDGRERCPAYKTRIRRVHNSKVCRGADITGGSSGDRYDRARGEV
jgi:uncharacterized protein (TIGR03435 family)